MKVFGKIIISTYYNHHLLIALKHKLLVRLHINDKQYYVEPPERERIGSEEIQKLGDVKSLVAQVSVFPLV